MSLVNIPSLGTVRAGSYYLLLPIIGFTLNVPLVMIIILLPAVLTLRSGWMKYPELRKFLAISTMASMAAAISFSGHLALATMVFMVATLPMCAYIAFKTKQIKRVQE